MVASPKQATEPTLRGCLFVCGAFFIMFALFIMYVHSCQIEETAQTADEIGTVLKSRETSTPGVYFQSIQSLWPKLAYKYFKSSSLPNWPTLRVDGTGGNYVFILYGSLDTIPGDPGSSSDLGRAARAVTTRVLSVAVWVCGHKVRDVILMKMHLSAYDGQGQSVIYDSELRPDSSIDKDWSIPSDQELLFLLDGKLKVVTDTASGKEWHRCTVRC
jgi:hypothetical protein